MNSEALEESKETLEVLYEISQLLNTGLDRTGLGLLVSLCENGVNPEALAAVVKELKRESASLKMAEGRP
jgi:mitotic-spindle organizing protein 1